MNPDVFNASLKVAPWILVSVLVTIACDGGSGDDTFECLGEAPMHASLCPGDALGLTADANRAVVAACSAAQPCEYQCDSGYRYDDGQCVVDDAVPTCEATGSASCYYIAPGGDDLNDGSIGAPFASTNPIIDTLEPGDYVYFRGGEYGEAAQGQIVDYAD